MKTIQAGPVELDLSVGNGAVVLKASLAKSADLGGGSAAGIAKGSVNLAIEADLGAQQGADLAFAVLKAHFPALSTEIAFLQSLADANLAKLSV